MITYKEYINSNDINNLLSLCDKSLKSFRYFNTRSKDVVLKHKYNVIFYCDSIPASYGHLDLDKNLKLWLGILVVDQHQGKGIGKATMEFLIDAFYKFDDKKLYLSVDENNLKAIELYKKFKFNFLEKKENVVYYVLEKD